MSDTRTHLLRLAAENWKKIKVFDLKVAGKNIVTIGGGNGQGKSSAIDALQGLLTGKKSFPTEPIRQGKKKAVLLGELEMPDGEVLLVQRKITPKSDSIMVSNEKGARYGSPQKMLDALMGAKAVGFDPGRFCLLSHTAAGRREQRQILLDLMGVDTSGLDGQRQTAYEERTDYNREVASLTARLEELGPVIDMPTEPDLDGLDEAYRNANDGNIERERRISDLRGELQRQEHLYTQSESAGQNVIEKCQDSDKEIEELLGRIEVLRREAGENKAHLDDIYGKRKEIESELRRLKDAVTQVPGPTDTTVLRDNYEQARDLQARINELQVVSADRNDLKGRIKVTSDLAAQRTTKIAEIEVAKVNVLSTSEFTVPGLAFRDDCITVNDVPIEQVSQSEQLRLAVRVAFKSCPPDGLKLCLIREGSLFDQMSETEIAQLAAEEDGLVLLERVIPARPGTEAYDHAANACTIVFENGLPLGNEDPDEKDDPKGIESTPVDRATVEDDAPSRHEADSE